MKNKLILVAITCIFSFMVLYGCSKDDESRISEAEKLQESEEVSNKNIPDISQVREICELATLECYYHNVAKSTKEKGSGLSHIGEKERKFWVEYNGVVKLGIETSKVNMIRDGNKIIITVPKAKVLGMSDYSFVEDNYISSDDGLNKNKITAEDQTKALADANEQIRQLFSNDEALLARAQTRAKELIENYINQLNEMSKTDYEIEWIYEDNNPERNEEDKITE